jgi:hypothetical protein
MQVCLQSVHRKVVVDCRAGCGGAAGCPRNALSATSVYAENAVHQSLHVVWGTISARLQLLIRCLQLL